MSIIAEDSLDTMGMMNFDGISEENKKLIEEFRHAFDRIKNNALQGGEVVRGLLKYSRTGKTGLEALTIDQILDSTIEMVRYKVKVDELNFLRLYSKELPFVLGNLTQLQEVFFNLIDNANDAIHERMEKAAEIDYRGTIQINAHTLPDGFIRIIFEDNGLGVKKEDQEKLFTPFFTTKVSSRQRQGTGLGLYVIKKIIGQYHNGRIFVESGFMKGTKFIIELPQTKKTEAKE
jgi:two-component system NtrC family sensor kinase